MLLAFDLDRTVVTDDGHLPDRIADAIEASRRAGHMVTVLTGRAHASARVFLERLDVIGPFSVNHGAVVMRDPGTEMRRVTLPATDVHALVTPYLHHDVIEFSCMVDEQLFVKNPSDPRWGWVHAQNRVITRFTSDFGYAADKVLFAASETSVTIQSRVARDLPHLEHYLWGDGFLEVIAAGADKGTALSHIAAHLGVDQGDVVAFGDGLNDVSMLRWAGRSIAVGPHVHPDALDASSEHIASPEEGGVAAWLEAHVL
ncbi:MAG: HAD family phosphatase [Trueperaceae bacterium]|nr:MAG: HAD family phosphatase [Trueperaceae bacterium]